MTKFKTWELSLLVALCFSLLTGTWAEAKQSDISSGLIRLHVIAVSDEEKEQSIKLQVRDAVLNYISPRLEKAEDASEAQSIVNYNLKEIQNTAEKASKGRKVKVTLSKEYYPTRDYENFCLPAGKYTSLRIILGEGKGHNWWCVVFPPLCISAAEREKAFDAMSSEEKALLTEKDGYVIKFRVLELWGELAEKFSEKQKYL